jgi:L-alanine-DL-glutamate epimerase-like enolase superfamily enzyme
VSTIERVETFPLRYPEPHDGGKLRHITLARVETDDGAVGWGECISQWPEAALAVRTLVDRGLGDLLVGEDPSDPRRLWEKLQAHAYWHGRGGIVSFANSALDAAVWDVAGKLAGKPAHALLGEQRHESFRACASIILDTLDLEHTAEQFAGFRERGYTLAKGGWGLVVEAGFGLDPDRDVQIAGTIRQAVGDEFDFVLDVSAHGRWTPEHAAAMARRLEEFRLFWFEDLLPHWDIDGWRHVSEATATPLTTGERCWTVPDYRLLAESGAIAHVLIDPGRVDGLTGMSEAGAAVAEHGVSVVPHSWSSAINTAAALHAMACMPNAHVFELKPNPSPMQHELVAVPFEQRDGRIAVPDAPGLGIEVDEGTVRRYAFD